MAKQNDGGYILDDLRRRTRNLMDRVQGLMITLDQAGEGATLEYGTVSLVAWKMAYANREIVGTNPAPTVASKIQSTLREALGEVANNEAISSIIEQITDPQA
jgi:hypothetical protein